MRSFGGYFHSLIKSGKGKEKDGRQNRLLSKSKSPGKYFLYLCPPPAVRCRQLVAKMLSLRFAGHISSPLTTYTYNTGLDDRLGWQNGVMHWGKAVIGWLTLHHVITPHSQSCLQKPQPWLSWEQAYRMYSKYIRSFNEGDETQWIFSFWGCELLWIWPESVTWAIYMASHGPRLHLFTLAHTHTHTELHGDKENK